MNEDINARLREQFNRRRTAAAVRLFGAADPQPDDPQTDDDDEPDAA